MASKSAKAEELVVCGYCFGNVNFERGYRCLSCDARIHFGCFEENQGCTTFGCQNANSAAGQA